MPSKDILVCGTLNVETTPPVDAFPLAYEPIRYRRFELRRHPSGVGFNVARALTVLGNRVRLASLVGADFLGRALRTALPAYGLSDEWVFPLLEETPQSVVVFDGAARRTVHTDLKDLGAQAYPAEVFAQALQGCRRTVMTNVNFSRPLLAQAKAAVASVATDLQTASEASRAYDADFLRSGGALFASFLHFYWDGDAPFSALRKALVFAGYKVGDNGAARGFLPEDQLLRLVASVSGEG